MLLLWAFGCGGGTSPSIEGCWEVLPARTTTECFNSGGAYTLDSPKLGEFDGKWRLSGASLEVAVGGFPADTYTATLEGDSLKLSNDERKMELVRAGSPKTQ